MEMGRKWKMLTSLQLPLVFLQIWYQMKGVTCSFIWVIFQLHRFLFSIFLSEKTWFFAKFKIFSKKKCPTFGFRFYTLVIVLLCIFRLKLSNEGSIFLCLKVLHGTPCSYVFYYPLKYYVFGRTNGNASNRNASNQHFSLYPLNVN